MIGCLIDDLTVLFQGVRTVGNLDDVAFVSVDDFGAVVVQFPGGIVTVGHMDMAVDQMGGAVFVEQVQKCPKSSVSRK